MNEKYSVYLLSKEWIQKRISCYRQAGKKCEGCGTGARLQTHHLTYARIFNELVTDLMCLCHMCHKAAESMVRDGLISRVGDASKLREQTKRLLNGRYAERQERIEKREQRKSQKSASNGQDMVKWHEERLRLWREARNRVPKQTGNIKGKKLSREFKAPRIRY